jgi:hypothetical protein
MNSQTLLYSGGNNNECYTPRPAVTPLLQFLRPSWKIWCPCDDDSSEFVRVFREAGYEVFATHIKDGGDFFNFSPKTMPFEFDAIVTNPPFTGKAKFVKHAMKFGKPTALLLPATWLNDASCIRIFAEVPLRFVFLSKRVEYVQADKSRKKGKVTFASHFYTINGFLPDDAPPNAFVEYDPQARLF